MMKFVGIGLLAGSAALMTFAAPVNAAPTTYTYSGATFDIVSAQYTFSDRVSGSITLANALASNLTSFVTVTPIAFSLSDGITTLSNTTSQVGSLFAFKTDALGEIYQWQAVVYVGSVSQYAISTVNAPGIYGANDHAYVNSGNSAYGQILNQPGTWTITAVPEPESYAMLLAGLAMIGGLARRRTQL